MTYLKKENIFFVLLLLYFFLMSAFQATDNHWSARIDQDIFLIYNSLLIYSGFEQDYLDHPAYSTFLILGGVYKILSFFISNFSLDSIINSNNIDQSLQRLFSIARVLNSFFLFIYIILIFKILKELNIKSILCFIAVLLLLTFHSIYEVLFLIRSEILSIIFSLFSFYLLIKFVKYEKSKIYCFFSGIFFCFAILAKIQVIFLIFIFVLIFPFLFSYFNYQNQSGSLVKNNTFFTLSAVLFCLFFIGYILFEFFYAFPLLIKYFSVFHYALAIPHFIDPILYCLFFFFYFILLKFISIKNSIKFSDLISLFFTIIYGVIFCILFIYLLDFINIASFNNKILFFLSNPMHKISMYSIGSFNPDLYNGFSYERIIQSLKDIFYNNYKLFPNKNLAIELAGTFIGIVDFFRVLITLLSGVLVIVLILTNKIKKNLPIIFLLFLGIIISHLSFGARDSLGYNIYLYPFILVLVFFTLNQFENKYIITSFLFTLFMLSFLEFYLLRNYYKLQFSRENRIYEICKIDKWKNSENYIKKYNENSYVPLTKNPRIVLTALFTKMDKEFFINYCEQLEKKASWKTNFFNIKID